MNMRFLSSVLFVSILSVVNAYAAPTVKRLGTNTARIGVNATTTSAPVASTTSASSAYNSQRLGSVRAKNISGGVNPSVSGGVPVSTTTAKIDDSRLSLGKYIHSSGITSGTIKPSVIAPEVSSNDFINLSDRVSALEDGVELKQDILTVGDGLVLENNTIGLDINIPTQIQDIQDELDTKVATTDLEENYYTKDDIEDIVEGRVGVRTDTIYDTATGQRKYVSIVDTFSSEILN